MKNNEEQETDPERHAIGMPRVLRAHQPDREARAFLRLANLSMGLRPAEDYSLPRLRQGWRLTALALGRRPGRRNRVTYLQARRYQATKTGVHVVFRRRVHHR
jgi:hypothetical protein